jgi:hypothetical protein
LHHDIKKSTQKPTDRLFKRRYPHFNGKDLAFPVHKTNKPVKKMSSKQAILHHEKPLSAAMSQAVRHLNLLRVDNEELLEDMVRVTT